MLEVDREKDTSIFFFQQRELTKQENLKILIRSAFGTLASALRSRVDELRFVDLLIDPLCKSLVVASEGVKETCFQTLIDVLRVMDSSVSDNN